MPVEGVCMEMIKRVGVVDAKNIICAKMHWLPKGTFSARYVWKYKDFHIYVFIYN